MVIESYSKEQLETLKKVGVDVSNKEKIREIMVQTLKDNDIDTKENEPIEEVIDLFLAIKEVEEMPKQSTKSSKKSKKVVEEDDTHDLQEDLLDELASEVKDIQNDAAPKKKEKQKKEVVVLQEAASKVKKRSAFTLFDQNNEEHLKKLVDPFKENFKDYELSYKIIHDGFSVKHKAFNSSGRTLYAIKRAKINNSTGEFIVTIAITGLRLHKEREELIKSLLKGNQTEKYGVEYGNMPAIYGISIQECVDVLKGCMKNMATTFEKLETRLNSNRVKMEEQVKGVKVKTK